MIEPPTDRLHKFLAVGGLTLIGLGTTVVLDRYDEAERRHIETIYTMEKGTLSYMQYIQEANRIFALAREYNKTPSAEKLKKLQDEIDLRESQDRELYLKASIDNAELERAALLALHYNNLKVVWAVIGTILIICGVGASFVGFRQWLRQPKRTR